MASADKVPMLEEGHRKLTDELKRLQREERPAIVEAIEAAALTAISPKMPNIMRRRSARDRSRR